MPDHYLSDDLGVGIIYLPTKIHFHRLINNGDLLADRNRWTDTHTVIHTQTESDTLPIKDIGSSKKY